MADLVHWSIAGQVFALVAVGALWGITNPLLKKGSESIAVEVPEQAPLLHRLTTKFLYLLTNWRSVGPFVLNQCGSVLFYLTLSTADLSLAVPMANSLAFFFTVLTGWFIGETVGNRSAQGYAGLGLMLVGITMCTVAKA